MRCRLSIPLTATEIAPVSSEDDHNDEQSVTLRSCRCRRGGACRVPLLRLGLLESGSIHPAAWIRPLRDDRSAVVQGRFGIENVFQKLRRRFRVEDRAGADLVVETVIALKDDERTGARCGHIHAGKHRLRVMAASAFSVCGAPTSREKIDPVPSFSKNRRISGWNRHDQREKAYLHGVAENIVHGVELRLAGQPERKE